MNYEGRPSCRPFDSKPCPESAKASDKLSHRLHLPFGHLGCDHAHHPVWIIRSFACPERLELSDGIRRMLTRKPWVLLRNPCSVGRMARGTGGNARTRVTSAVEILA